MAAKKTGISGNISADGLRRLDRDVLEHHPDLVVVMFGMNDVARSTPEAYEANLRQILDRCRLAGTEVVLCTPNTIGPDPSRPLDKLRAHADIVRRLAAELAVPLADCFAAFEAVAARDLAAWQALMSDNIHPNMRGHKLFAEIMAETITGRSSSLADVGPLPGLPHVKATLAAGQPLRVIAMPPLRRPDHPGFADPVSAGASRGRAVGDRRAEPRAARSRRQGPRLDGPA